MTFTRGTAVRPGTGRFIGREHELGLLGGALAAAQAGEGAFFLINGEAGVGKTRFCLEVDAHAARLGLTVAWGRCWPGDGAPPLWPWQAILRDLGERDLGERDLGERDLDERDLDERDLDERDLDDVMPPGDLGDLGGRDGFATFTAVADVLARSPALILLDDLHHADPGALRLTRFVARSVARLPVVLLATCRHLPDALPEGECTAARLRPFTLQETSAFFRRYGHDAIDPELMASIHRLTRGNPLLLKRVVVAMAPSPTAADAGVDGVRAGIEQATRRLSSGTCDLLAVAALLGSSVSLSEVSEVAGVPTKAVCEAVEEAEPAGLVSFDGRWSLAFTHDLVRHALRDRLSVAERADLHARAAEVLESTGHPAQRLPGGLAEGPAIGRAGDAADYPADPARLASCAHHAIRAASRSAEDAERAVTICRRAARAMVWASDYGRAAELLASAAAMGPGPVSAELLVEWAEAVLMSGRVAEARVLFDRAAAATPAASDPYVLARASAGLGGMWVAEHRDRVDRERVRGLQRRALAALPADRADLRLRLQIRLAAERVYRGAPAESVVAVLGDVRRLGDDAVLAEALSLTHHALLAPDHAHERLSLADELIAVAARAGHGMLALMGLCRRTADLFLLGDPRAERSLAELRRRAESLDCSSIRYIAEAMSVMLLIRAGRLDEAEARAEACHRLGSQAGDPNADGYLGAHVTTIRWIQGRDAEMLETVRELDNSPTLVPVEFAFRAVHAAVTARMGDHEQARVLLAKLLVPHAPSSTWLVGMLAVVEAAWVIGHENAARYAYGRLLPYRDRPVMASLGIACLGSCRRPLGLAAMTMGDLDGAIAHLERAVAANHALGNRPITAIAQADLAEALRRRGSAEDRARASTLLAEATAAARAIGMTARVSTWMPTATIQRYGRHWLFRLNDQQALVSNSRGVHHIVRLLTNPGRPIRALDLAADLQGGLAPTGGQPVLDGEAMAAYQRHARDLARQIDRAEQTADQARADYLRERLDALLIELKRSTGRNGQPRNFPDPAERARTAVQKAIKRAIEELAVADPAIGAVLRATITTGTTCRYEPTPEHEITWTVAGRLGSDGSDTGADAGAGTNAGAGLFHSTR